MTMYREGNTKSVWENQAGSSYMGEAQDQLSRRKTNIITRGTNRSREESAVFV